VHLLPSGHSFQLPDKSDTWIHRVAENLRQTVFATGIKGSPGALAPLHFESIELSARNGTAQTFSAGFHVILLAALLFAMAAAPSRVRYDAGPLTPIQKLLPYVPTLHPQSIGQPSLGPDGSGGGRDTQPARFGNLAPFSSMPLASPRLNRNKEDALPVPPAVFDPNAPTNVPTVAHLGLPWMDADTDSAGRGRGHGFGEGDGDTMGDGKGHGVGDGDGTAPYANVVSPVVCIYCPEPGYTDEARKAKLEGKMLLQVLVGPDGKAERIEILHGLGMGLDELARETIRKWQFSPGRDAAKRPVASWVTIESRFQLF
jgi:protein TonB